MSSNSLTQVINNITSGINQMNAALAALPAPAPNQANMVAALQGSVPLLQSMQSQILSFAKNASSVLNYALSDINNSNYSDATTKIQAVNTSANTLKTATNDANTQLSKITPQIISVGAELNNMRNSLSSQLASLQGQLQDAQNQVDYYNKRKWYFLLLGPFGIAGVATAVALIVTWTQKVNGYQSDVNNINNQINAANNSINSVCNAQSVCIDSINNVSSINNTVDVMFADITEVIADLSSTTPVTAKLYVTAALTEVQILETDAL